VRVRRLTIAVDAGLIINPDGAENQRDALGVPVRALPLTADQIIAALPG
jgi:CO/xanthine dehydrogenase Mo-binding subunit